MSRTKGAGAILFKEGKVLLVKHSHVAKQKTGVYGLPAGRWQEGETEKQTAIRELFEETGLVAAENEVVEFPGNYVEATLEMKSGPEDHSFRVFIAKSWKGELKGSEEAVPEWMDLEKIETIPTVLNVVEMIKKAIEHLKTL
jgi:8-oxo-dGTP pyrophosphatase MutT (NUDIX family)